MLTSASVYKTHLERATSREAGNLFVRSRQAGPLAKCIIYEVETALTKGMNPTLLVRKGKDPISSRRDLPNSNEIHINQDILDLGWPYGDTIVV